MSPIQKAQAVARAQAVLGVGPNASEAELRAAWRKLTFLHHPDRGAGSDAEMANVNAAYSLLREKRVLSRQLSDVSSVIVTRREEARRVTPSRPASMRRPSLQMRRDAIPGAAVEACRAALPESDGIPCHIPNAIERIGRKMTFIVFTPLSEGMNRIALPAMTKGADAPQVITFRASSSGAGTLDMPESLSTRMFPEATSVQIAFGRA